MNWVKRKTNNQIENNFCIMGTQFMLGIFFMNITFLCIEAILLFLLNERNLCVCRVYISVQEQ